jgi:LDH2 family malate/lactate/ureidoglycolate dehydrogenase
MDLPGAAPWIKVKGIATGVPATEINPLVFEFAAAIVPVGKWF